jgi:putative ABC transport system permease protein
VPSASACTSGTRRRDCHGQLSSVVADTKIGPRDELSADQWYSPAQQPAILYGSESAGKFTDPAGGYITVRSALPSAQMRDSLRSTIAEIDPLLALQQVQPMNDVISNVEAPRRFNTDLITAFALVALLLAITGIYAVVAFSVSLHEKNLPFAWRSGLSAFASHDSSLFRAQN